MIEVVDDIALKIGDETNQIRVRGSNKESYQYFCNKKFRHIENDSWYKNKNPNVPICFYNKKWSFKKNLLK